MSTNQRKTKRAGDLVRRAQSAKQLEVQLEDLHAQLDIANRCIEERNVEIRTARTAVTDEQTAYAESIVLHTAIHNELERAQRAHLDDVTRLETAVSDRGEHIERLIAERNNARAAKDIAERRAAAMEIADRDSKKLRRRLAEAKEKIAELQTTISRLRRAETNEVTF